MFSIYFLLDCLFLCEDCKNYRIFPIKFFYWKDDNLKFGISEVRVSNYQVHMTDLERSVCDAVKYRNKIGSALCSEIIWAQ
jgi:hypothetical protein